MSEHVWTDNRPDWQKCTKCDVERYTMGKTLSHNHVFDTKTDQPIPCSAATQETP